MTALKNYARPSGKSGRRRDVHAGLCCYVRRYVMCPVLVRPSRIFRNNFPEFPWNNNYGRRRFTLDTQLIVLRYLEHTNSVFIAVIAGNCTAHSVR